MDRLRYIKIVKSLIDNGKLYSLKATVNLNDDQCSLTLSIPVPSEGGESSKNGKFRTKSFTLAQSSEVIISILCMEIPYTISDLLCAIELPVFYQGFLIVEINDELRLLEPSYRSLGMDLQFLLNQVSHRKRVHLERAFWLRVRRRLKIHKPKLWCPAKEAYRSHLKALINWKLCNHLGFNKKIRNRLKVIQDLSDARCLMGEKDTLPKFNLSLPLSSIERHIPTLQNPCYLSIFNGLSCSPSEILSRRGKWARCSKLSGSNCTMVGKYMDIAWEQPPSINESNGIKSERRVVRLIEASTGHYWAKPESVTRRNDPFSNHMSNSSFIGTLPNCAEYVDRLFSSITEHIGAVVPAEIHLPVCSVSAMESVLPSYVRHSFRSRVRGIEAEENEECATPNNGDCHHATVDCWEILRVTDGDGSSANDKLVYKLRLCAGMSVSLEKRPDVKAKRRRLESECGMDFSESTS